jgi:DNA-binding NarL/FixJ family response regulator
MYFRRKPYKILVVDDIKKWRDVTCSILSERHDLQVIGQASDGLNAVELARTLQPDIVILDIGLPVLNGFEVARRIRDYCPASLIIFLSAHKSQEMVSAALNLGVNAFVAKTDVQQLLQSIEYVLAGRRFISKSSETTITVPHELELFQDEESLLDSFANYIKRALDAKNAAIVLVSDEHEIAIRSRLLLNGVDVSQAIKSGTYIPVDVREILSSIIVDGRSDPTRFEEVTRRIIGKGIRGQKRDAFKITLCAQCAPALWSAGLLETATELERLWDEFARVHSIETLCGYVQDHGIGLENIPSFVRICSHHTFVRGLNSQTS